MSMTTYISIQYAKTQCDSSEEIEYQPNYCKTNPLKHKTQLCKTYSELGYCNYGDKCRFAHGKHQLVYTPVNQALRKRKCNGYWGKGFCNYGVRCQFGHGEQNHNDQLLLEIAKRLVKVQDKRQSRLLQIVQGK